VFGYAVIREVFSLQLGCLLSHQAPLPGQFAQQEQQGAAAAHARAGAAVSRRRVVDLWSVGFAAWVCLVWFMWVPFTVVTYHVWLLRGEVSGLQTWMCGVFSYATKDVPRQLHCNSRAVFSVTANHTPRCIHHLHFPCRHGQEQAAAMYNKLPQLLLYRTPNLRRKTAAIAEALGLNPTQANQLVRSDPRLMTYAPETLQQRAEALQELLQLPGQAVLRKVVMGWPSLLRKSTQSIAGM
jgi:hypothetical protein